MTKTISTNQKNEVVFLNYQQIAKSIKDKKVARLYLISGEEEFLIEKVIKALSKLILAPGCEEADSYQADWKNQLPEPDRLKELIGTVPFMSVCRLVIIKNPGLFNSKGTVAANKMDKYKSILQAIPEFCCLVLWEEKIDKRKKSLISVFEDPAVAVLIPRQNAEELSRYAAILLQRSGVKIRFDAVASLVDRVEGSLRLLDNEVQKLALYATYNQLNEIDQNILDLICLPDIRGSVFKMTDALGMKQAGRALIELEKLITLREPLTKIRFMLARHIRQLICAKELNSASEVAKIVKTVPFVAKNLVKQANFFQMEELLNVYRSCAEMDLKVKTGQIDERIALELLLTSII